MYSLGKLLPLSVFVGVVACSSASLAQSAQLFAVLNGGNEVSAGGQAAVGDPNGYGAATVIFTGAGGICYSIIVNSISVPTAAHIHEEWSGMNGPLVIPLSPPDHGSPGTVSDCIFGLDTGLLDRLRRTPGDFYINVHTDKFPGGAIRGQLQ